MQHVAEAPQRQLRPRRRRAAARCSRRGSAAGSRAPRRARGSPARSTPGASTAANRAAPPPRPPAASRAVPAPASPAPSSRRDRDRRAAAASLRTRRRRRRRCARRRCGRATSLRVRFPVGVVGRRRNRHREVEAQGAIRHPVERLRRRSVELHAFEVAPSPCRRRRRPRRCARWRSPRKRSPGRTKRGSAGCTITGRRTSRCPTAKPKRSAPAHRLGAHLEDSSDRRGASTRTCATAVRADHRSPGCSTAPA